MNGLLGTVPPADSVASCSSVATFFAALGLTCVPHFQDVEQDFLHVMEVTARDLVNVVFGNVVVVKLRRVNLSLSLLMGLSCRLVLCSEHLLTRAWSYLCVTSRFAPSRWMTPHNPDVGTTVVGEQFRAIRTFLEQHQWTEFIWFYFGCLPQKLRIADNHELQDLNHCVELIFFKETLSVVNLLHLHARVLILLDVQYSSRFWCLYEAFLAMLEFDGPPHFPPPPSVPQTVPGLIEECCCSLSRSITFDEWCCSFVLVSTLFFQIILWFAHSSGAPVYLQLPLFRLREAGNHEGLGRMRLMQSSSLTRKALFSRQWGEIDVKRFVRRMHGDDIHVTNRSDKDHQLQSLENLLHLLRHLHQVIGFGESEFDSTILEMRTTRWCVETYLTPLETNSTLHGKKTCNEAPGHANHQSNCTQIFSSCSVFEPFHFQEIYPNMSAELFHFGHLWRHNQDDTSPAISATSVALTASHQRVNVGISAIGRLVVHVLHLLITLPNALPILSSLVHSGPTAWHPLLLSFKICALPSPCCGLREFMQKPSTAFRTLDHLMHPLLMQFFHLSLLIFLFRFLQPNIPFLHGFFHSWMEPSFLAVCRQQLSNPQSIFGIHSVFLKNDFLPREI